MGVSEGRSEATREVGPEGRSEATREVGPEGRSEATREMGSEGDSELARAVVAGDRAALARAITLVESTRADHRDDAQQLLLDLTPKAGDALRVGITGVPGVGKSTAIEALGMYLIEQGHRVA